MNRILRKILLIIVLFEYFRIGNTFKIDWKYSELGIPDLNSPECGLAFEPIISELSFEAKCFRNSYNKRTFFSFDRHQEKDSPNERVFKGEDPFQGEAGFTVFVRPRIYQNSFFYAAYLNSTCTGVLITFEWVLTAAHCLEDWSTFSEFEVLVSAGANHRRGTQSLKMNKYFLHPIYVNPNDVNQKLSKDQIDNRKQTHDIALIKLKSKFFRQTTKNKEYFVNTICLPEKAILNNRESQSATFFGYGVINNEGVETETLKKGQVQLFDTLNVGQQSINICEDNTFCGQFPPKTQKTCKGDSGGPLIQYTNKKEIRAVLIGVLRSRIKRKGALICDQNTMTGRFTAVPSFIDWILKTMANN